MRWYKNRDVKDGEISHPVDGEEWKNFDRRYPSFAQEIRNIRLALATDGFNPFGPNGKKTYSVWPMVIVVYNLPPSMCMKKPYMFMTDIVPGSNSIGKDINIYLRPLIDELKILWNNGSKDHKKARADCKHFGVLPHLWIDEKGNSSKAPYSLTRKQRKLLCELINSLKLPDGYSSNISRCCNVEECTFYGFKSHNCHLFLQKLLPLAIRELLPAPIVDAITIISNFFRDLCSSVVTKTDLEIMEKSVIKVLCLLETIFPQSWFDSMQHLVVYLAEEIRLAGPAYWHWMYPTERLLGKLKQKVGNKVRVEGSISERYMEEEILNICSFYFASDTIHYKVRRNEVLFDVQNSENLEVFKYPIQSLGKEGTRYMSDDERELAEEYVLLNSFEVQPYLRKYQDRVMRQRPETTPQDLYRIVKSRFKTWLIKMRWKDLVLGTYLKGRVGNGVRIDKNHVITINMTSRLKSNEIFILASQASQVYYVPSVLDPKAKIYTVVKSKSLPIDKSIVAQNDIEDAFHEDRSNASISFSLFVDFAQYGQISFIRREEDEEDDLKDDEDENEAEEEISEGDNENDDDDEDDDDGFDDFE
ncbi:uncharacterized protein LOC141664530 [Apium graveolens]|uniref:uncharacterized protein LOC141664530 n=1 Tax=Apium graveolens TaxID=4045 RepID=UPI003D78D8F7